MSDQDALLRLAESVGNLAGRLDGLFAGLATHSTDIANLKSTVNELEKYKNRLAGMIAATAAIASAATWAVEALFHKG